MASDGARLSAETLAFAGRVWKRALAHQADALMLLGAHYRLAENFRLIPWDELGSELQNDIARELAAFLELCAKAGRA